MNFSKQQLNKAWKLCEFAFIGYESTFISVIQINIVDADEVHKAIIPYLVILQLRRSEEFDFKDARIYFKSSEQDSPHQ